MTLMLDLMAEFGLGYGDLYHIIDTAPARYKVYTIPKKDGNLRTIAHPSKELKQIQRFIVEHVLSKFPVHQAAAAYVRGKGIINNASAHKNSDVILKLDFKSFFPSIKVRDWELYIRSSTQKHVNENDLKYYSKLLFWNDVPNSKMPKCLSIGAPSSPIISNILLFSLDTELSDLANFLGVNYTRYADDITVSSKNTSQLTQFESSARKVVRELQSPKLTFNEDKRGLYTKGQRRLVTGLIITPDNRISIGRARKREISALIHQFSIGVIDIEKIGYLKGMLAFCIANEGTFVNSMRSKYGNKSINDILTFYVPVKGT